MGSGLRRGRDLMTVSIDVELKFIFFGELVMAVYSRCRSDQSFSDEQLC